MCSAVRGIVVGGVTRYSVKALLYARGMHNYSRESYCQEPSAITALETRAASHVTCNPPLSNVCFVFRQWGNWRRAGPLLSRRHHLLIEFIDKDTIARNVNNWIAAKLKGTPVEIILNSSIELAAKKEFNNAFSGHLSSYEWFRAGKMLPCQDADGEL